MENPFLYSTVERSWAGSQGGFYLYLKIVIEIGGGGIEMRGVEMQTTCPRASLYRLDRLLLTVY